MVVADGKGIPLGNHLDSASPAEVTLIETTLDKAVIPRKRAGHPKRRKERLIYDKAADSDQLRERLKSRGIELVRLIDPIGASGKRRTEELFADTNDDGKWKELFPGLVISEGWLFVMSGISRSTRLFSISHVC